MWKMYKEEGYVCNPQSGKPFSTNLQDMHSTKLMNYMMQSLETSNNITILKDVLRYLRDKKTFICNRGAQEQVPSGRPRGPSASGELSGTGGGADVASVD